MSQFPRFDPWILWATIVSPCVLAIAQGAWILAISDRLPTRMATHWDNNGAPDDFMSPGQSALIFGLITIVCAQIGWFSATTKTVLVSRKTMAFMNLILSGFLIGTVFAVVIPQIDIVDPTTARIGWLYSILGAAIGLLVGIVVARRVQDYSALADATVHERTSPRLPHRSGEPTPIDVRVTYSTGTKMGMALWAAGSLALTFFLPVLGVIFLLCTPLFLMAYETGMKLDTAPETDSITVFTGCGPAKMTHHILLKTIKYAEPGEYHWADGGGIGMSFGNDGRVTVAARSGEAVKIETSGSNYTVVVPDGMAATVAGEINSRIDAMR